MTEEQQLIKHSIYTDIEEQRIITDFASDPVKLLKLADNRALRPGPVSSAFIEYLNGFADSMREQAAKMIHQARQLHEAAQALTDLNTLPDTEEQQCTPHSKTPTE
jgi:hypothetical protein